MTAPTSATLLRPTIHLFGRNASSFLTLGALGFIAGIGVPALLAPLVGRSPLVILAMGALSIGTFLALAMWTKVRTGEESLTFYHHAIAVSVVLVASLLISGQPLLPYLDLAMIGLATFLVLGRIGCLVVGCCHGRPADWGVRYSAAHRQEGLPWYLVGVPLVPVQAFEAVWILVAVLGGGLVVLGTGTAGAVLGWTVASYAVGRFGLEFLRGDPGRSWRLGFTEAQWTSLVLALVATIAAAAGLIPSAPWQPAAVLVIATAFVVVAVRRRHSRIHLLLRADHVHHLAEVAEGTHRSALADPSDPAPIGVTGMGVRLSASHVDTDLGLAHVYGLSGEFEPLRHEEAAAIGRLLVRLRHGGASWRLLDGQNQVHHVLVLEV